MSPWTKLAIGAVATALVSVLVTLVVVSGQSDTAQEKATSADQGAEQADKKAEEAQDRSKATVRYLQGKRGSPGLSGKPGAAGKPGAPGKAGRAPTPAEVGKAVRAYCDVNSCQGPSGPTGGQGADAPRISVQDLVAAISQYCDSRGGCRGPAGKDGSDGAKGDPGESVTGPQGETGATGPQGDAGPQGDQGSQGPPPSPEQILDAAAAFLVSSTFECTPQADPPGSFRCQITTGP